MKELLIRLGAMLSQVIYRENVCIRRIRRFV